MFACRFARLFHRPPPLRPPPRLRLRPRLLFPLAGGLLLFVVPARLSLVPVPAGPPLISSPSPPVSSPSSPPPHLSLHRRILDILRSSIWEPILTAKRFVYLLVLFMPVIICSPMLLVGRPKKRFKGDRWGAVWWYGLLVKQMSAAGPTFIKVCTTPHYMRYLILSFSPACAVGCIQGRFVPYPHVREIGHVAFTRKATLTRTYKERHRACVPTTL